MSGNSEIEEIVDAWIADPRDLTLDEYVEEWAQHQRQLELAVRVRAEADRVEKTKLRESVYCSACGLLYRAIGEWKGRCPNNNCVRHGVE